MPVFDATRVKAVVFDYGNTLVPFGPEQFGAQRDALVAAIAVSHPEVDGDALAALRDQQVRRPYDTGYRENDLDAMCTELFRAAVGRDPDGIELQRMLGARHQAFLDSVPHVSASEAVLEVLSARFTLGLVSNYPCGAAIRDSVAAHGWMRYFASIVVSAEIGWCKPHPAPFEVSMAELGMPAEAIVYVGDNWIADVQGARRQGMQSVLVREYVPHARFDPEPGDLEPHAILHHLADLPALLGFPARAHRERGP